MSFRISWKALVSAWLGVLVLAGIILVSSGALGKVLVPMRAGPAFYPILIGLMAMACMAILLGAVCCWELSRKKQLRGWSLAGMGIVFPIVAFLGLPVICNVREARQVIDTG